MPDLEERVAALEEMLANPSRWFILPSWQPLTADQEAELRSDIGAALAAVPQSYRALPPVPPLTPDQVRCLLRECVTVVQPGETLVIRGRDWTPNQVREIQRAVDAMREDGAIGFKVLAVTCDELAVAEPGP